MQAQPGLFRLTWHSGLCPASLFFLFLGGIFAALGGIRLSKEVRYRSQGVHVHGTVVSTSIEHASGDRSSTGYIVAYRFTTREGVASEASDEVDADRWDELRPGGPFEIVYLPGSPASSRAATTSDMPLALAFTAVGAFVFLVGGVVLAIGVRTAARQLAAGLAVTLALLAAATGCRRPGELGGADPRPAASRAVVGGLSFSLPEGFVQKTYERSREPLLNIPGQSTEQVFASWEAPGERCFTIFYWSEFPPHDLGPMVAAKRWKTRIAGQETEVAETETFMGVKQRVLVASLERPGGGGRFMVYTKNVPRETFDTMLATMSWRER